MPRKLGLIIGAVLTWAGFIILDVSGETGILLAIPGGTLFGTGTGVFIYFWNRRSPKPPHSNNNTTEV